MKGPENMPLISVRQRTRPTNMIETQRAEELVHVPPSLECKKLAELDPEIVYSEEKLARVNLDPDVSEHSIEDKVTNQNLITEKFLSIDIVVRVVSAETQIGSGRN